MKHPWMPIFWGDFFANTLHLSAQEAGAYLFLIGHAWEHEGRIPVDRLKQIARVSPYHWPRVRDRLELFFNTTMESNFWIHNRVLTELAKAEEKSNKYKEAALQSHSKRRANLNGSHVLPQPQSFKKEEASKRAPASALPTGAPARSDRSETKSSVPLSQRSVELQMASKQHLGIAPDKGMDYRAPPAAKSANVLQPVPDRPTVKRPSEPENLSPGNYPQCSNCNCPKSPSGEQKCWASILANSHIGTSLSAQEERA